MSDPVKGMTAPRPRRIPMIEGWNGTPCAVHWHRATEVAPGVKVGGVLMDDSVTDETATHIMTITYTLEPKP